MLQETLKQATKHNHDELEQLMFVHEIMSGSLSVQQYKQILTTNYLVHKAVEQKLVNGVSADLAENLDLEHRNKLAALEADMLEMDLPLTDDHTNLPPIDFESEAAILGALYVLEGATLGGSVIVKRLKTNPAFASLNPGFHYYQVYGENLIPNWKKFCEVLNQQPEDTFNQSVTGAQQMFNYIASVQQLNNQLV
jgi:heme oxygenase